MELTKKVPTTDKNQENNHLLRMLDRGIDDMEAGRELPLEDAFRKITELMEARTKATIKNYFNLGTKLRSHIHFIIYLRRIRPATC